MELTYTFVKQKIDVGKLCDFSDSDSQNLVDILPDKNCYSEYVYKNPINKGVQCGQQYAEHEVNTIRLSYENRGMNHTEGGWPKDVNPSDTEQTIRYKKKIEKDDMYIHSVHQLSHTMERYILQNNAINIYERYFEEQETVPILEDLTFKTVNVFTDRCSLKRAIQYLSWSPDGGTQIAASYCNLDFQNVYTGKCIESFIWQIDTPSKPEMMLQYDVPIVCLEYNPKDPHSLLSGLYNGQVAFWDTRKGNGPVEISTQEYSHREPVTRTLWISSKSGTEFFSSSSDGQIMWWDARKLHEPAEILIADITKNETQQLNRAHGISCLEYENSIPIRFMVGTETGIVISGNRKGKTPAEKLSATYKVHQGPVYSLQRNPAFIKIFLTIGDWSAKIWSEDCKESAIMWTNYHQSRLTSGTWSPTRYSVYFITKVDGTLDIWDILQNQKEQILTIQVCNEPLRCIRCHENGQTVAVASDNGCIYLLEFSENLSVMAKNDKALLTSIFERESRREKIIESKMKEMRLKSKVGKVIDSHLTIKDTAKSAVAFNMDHIHISNAEKEFFSIIEQENNRDVKEES